MSGEVLETEDSCWYQESCSSHMTNFLQKTPQDPDKVYHLRVLKTMFDMCEGDTVIDLGTGGGEIGKIVSSLGYEFHGADLPHIITDCAMLNNPQFFYRGFDIINDDLSWTERYDVVVLNGVIDVMAYPLGVLRRVLEHSSRYVILHRQEISNGPTRYEINKSYGGKTFHSIINHNDLRDLLSQLEFEIIAQSNLDFSNWEDGGCSFLLLNKKYKLRKYQNHPLRQLRNRVASHTSPLKVVLGGGDRVHHPDWIVTNQEELDVEVEDDWKFLFGARRVQNLFAEHVWEHLDDPYQALKNCYNYLSTGGRLRIAVPDGYHPDPNYIDDVRPGGKGFGADDHKNLFNIDSLGSLMALAGFEIEPLEYWKDGKFYHLPWDPENGFVHRSMKDPRNEHGLFYTSLIIDAKKC